MPHPLLRLTANTWLLGLESSAVVPLRLLRLARLGGPAAREARLMVSEKIEAHGALLRALSRGELGGGAVEMADGAVRHYLGYVRANRERLWRDFPR